MARINMHNINAHARRLAELGRRELNTNLRLYLEAYVGRGKPSAVSARIPLAIAIQAANGELKRAIQAKAPIFGMSGKRWLPPDYPKFWQWKFAKLGTFTHDEMVKSGKKGIEKPGSKVIFYPGTRRPHKRIHNNVLVKMSRKYSTADIKACNVYVRFSRKRTMWDVKNAWYGRFVEEGTRATEKRKWNTTPRPYFFRGLRAGATAAENKYKVKIDEIVAKYAARINTSRNAPRKHTVLTP